MIPAISPELRATRLYLQFKLSHAKTRLARAYAYGSEDKFHKHRVRQAKISLIRILLELHGSPELGPQLQFKWGYRIRTMIEAGADAQITSIADCTFWEAACILGASLREDSYVDE